MTNLALIGKGRWGQNYITEAESVPGCQIKYIRGKNYKDLGRRYEDIDGIIIASPATTHLDIINQLQYKPLLVEKPVFMSEDEILLFRPGEKKQLMAAHTYVYHPAIRVLKGKPVRYLTFKLLNTERYGSDTSMLWELGPHGVAICHYLFGYPNKITAHQTKTNNVDVTLYYPHTTCHLVFGWNSNHKIRELSIDTKDISLEVSPSPLSNELIAFMQFIQTGETITGLEHISAVTMILSNIQQLLYDHDNHPPLL